MITIIENDNKNLEEKVNYFLRYSTYLNRIIGLIPVFPLDNFSTIFNKIIFENKNNKIEIGKYRNLTRYCNCLAFDEIIYVDESNLFDKISNLNTLAEESASTIKINKINENCAIDLLKLIDQNDFNAENYFEIVLNRLFSFLNCSHNLNEHKEYIQLLSLAIAVNFRNNGYSEVGFEDILKDIFNDENLKEFKQEQDDDEEFDQVTFQKQFSKIKLHFERKDTNLIDFYFGVKGVFTKAFDEETDSVLINRVTFYRKEKFGINEIRNHIIFKDYETVANIKIPVDLIKDGKMVAYQIINSELTYLKNMGCADAIVNLKSLIYSLNNQDFIEDGIGFGRVGLEEIEKNSFHHILREVESEAKDVFLGMEEIIQSAFSQNNISLFWIYFEAIGVGFNTYDLKKIISKILFENKDKLLDICIEKISFLFSIYNFGKFSGRRPFDLIKSFIANEDNDSELETNLHQAEIDFLNKVKDLKDKDWMRKFEIIISELYEARNLQIHSGLTNSLQYNKLIKIVPTFMMLFRIQIANDIKSDPSKNITEILEKYSS